MTADRAKQSQFEPAQRNRWGKPHPTSGRNCAKRTQFSSAGRQAGDPGGGANVQNKANLARASKDGRGRAEDPHGEQLCETKPISARATGGASAFQKRSYGKSYMQQALTKQSQFAPAHRNRWGKPHPTSGRNYAKQTQFRPAGQQAGDPGRGKCAKQTQLPEAGHRGGVSIADFGLETDRRRDACPSACQGFRSCKTKPICARPEESVGQAGTPNAVCRVREPDPPYKWAQLRQTNPIQAGRTARRRPWEGPMCETKPISGRRPAGRGPRGVGRQSNAQNKPNLRRAGREDHRQGRRPRCSTHL